MGAKQSKRSVDISGKEAEGAGEVAAAGAGGEGRVEPIADVDTLKPQLNGDTPHIQPPEEITDKEKQLENGTPENEKDATTEKEAKEKEGDKEAAPVTNGDAEQAEEKKENGDAPAAEETKKPKKEKVKKKWSLRSISFSRKDKPKQEKKQKDEEAKTNGEPEKVPEEAAETVAVEGEKQAEEAKPAAEIKEEKTPETPVTEPITNGSSTPESPKEVSSPAEDPAPQERPETKAVTEPEQLPVNGLSLDEPKQDKVEEPKVESKPEEPEPAPVLEIPAKTEVCVEQLPTIETTTPPPPLPANPPPSSVASFAATTMAPELTDTSLAKADEPAPPATDVDNIEVAPADNEMPSPVPSPTTNDVTTEDTTVVPDEQKLGNTENELVNVDEILPASDLKQSEIVNSESPVVPDNVAQNELPEPVPEVLEEVIPEPEEIVEPVQDDAMPEPPVPENVESEETNIEESEAIHTQQVIEVVESVEAVIENVSLVENNHVSPVANGIEDIKLNGDANLTEQENLKNKTKEHVIETIECNGHGDESSVKTLEDKSESESDILPPAPCEEISQPAEEISESFPLPPSELSQADSSPELPATPTQETIVSDKLADLIPELPELPTETIQETASDVQVAN